MVTIPALVGFSQSLLEAFALNLDWGSPETSALTFSFGHVCVY